MYSGVGFRESVGGAFSCFGYLLYIHSGFYITHCECS